MSAYFYHLHSTSVKLKHALAAADHDRFAHCRGRFATAISLRAWRVNPAAGG